MAFQTPKTIEAIITDIQKGKFYLPAIQREFVWKPEQIERLFDSLMQGYPIGSFLFWQVEKDNLTAFKFYKFIQHYHENNNRHNETADLSQHTEAICAILDGQQRLTSLFIGLTGSYSYKTPYLRWDNPNAFPKRQLCLNLWYDENKELKNNEIKYEFKFLTKEEQEKSDTESPTIWFPVADILKFRDSGEIYEYIEENYQDIHQNKPHILKSARRMAVQLFDVIKNKPIINYYLETDTSLDKVLNIFIRINSGGTILSYSDLLLSFATAQWKEIDAREEINQCVDTINEIKNGFNINKDFILRSCLVLADISQIEFKVDNFTHENMSKIEKNWFKIKEVLQTTYYLLSQLGFSRDNLASNNAVIPVAYYIYQLAKQNQDINRILEHKEYESDRLKIKEWIIKTTLKQTFSGTPEGVLRPIQNAIKEYFKHHTSGFPLAEIMASIANTNKAIVFTDNDVDNLLTLPYGKPATYAVLSLLYPHLDYSHIFHQDHIFPQAKMTMSFLKKQGFSEEICQEIMNKMKTLPNLQLLHGSKNKEKSDMLPEDWLNKQNFDKHEYARLNHFPDDLGLLNIQNCLAFMNQREEKLRIQLKALI